MLNNGNLVDHQATHSEVRSCKCSICPEGRYFKTKSQLSNHMVYHYEPKYSCSQCDHKSYTNTHLSRHKKLMVNNKLFCLFKHLCIRIFNPLFYKIASFLRKLASF